MNLTWQIILTPVARAQIRAITDMRIRTAVIARIDDLTHEPEQRGKPLFEELAGHYSVRAVGQRYRIIYQLNNQTVIVHVVAIGRRKQGDKNDIYTLARRLFRQGLLDPDLPTDEEG